MKRIKEGFLPRLVNILEKKIQKKEGQSSIEFIISFFFVIGFVFVFLKIALNATEGYMIHYATFMASRSYLVAQQNTFQENNSAKAFSIAKKAYRSIIKNGLNNLKDHGPQASTSNLFVGVFTSFKRKFSAGIVGGGRKMEMISESYLGREPTKEECRLRVCKAFNLPGGTCGAHTTVFDNGC